MDYVNFDLEVERAEPGYRPRVLGSPMGSARGDLTLRLEGLSLEQFLTGVGRENRGLTRDLHPAEPVQVDSESMTIDYGTQLFEFLFSGDLKEMLHRSLDSLPEERGLRLRLRLTDVPELGQLPWEYLYDPDRKQFLACFRDTPLVRYLDLKQPITSLQVPLPLKILVVIACPADQVPIDADQEWQKIRDALFGLESEGRIKLERLDGATKLALLDRLSQEDYHILQFIGHGDFDPQREEGILLMEDGAELTLQEMGMLLGEQHRTLRLVILNACKGARSSLGDPFDGLAQSLIQQGIPAVIAMQYAITDEGAIAFARDFYRELARGRSVEEALTHARKALYMLKSKLEWATPVLFLRSDQGQIFEIPAEDQLEGADVLPSPYELGEESATRVRALPEYVTCFVDREKQCDFFLKMIDGKTPKQVMEVEAPDRMGKTFLIGRLLHECREKGRRVARIDFSDYKWDHVDIVSKARTQLGKDHFPRMTQLMDEHKNLFDEARTSQSLEHRLMEAFFEDLRELSRDRVVVLLFDSYDESPPIARDWLSRNLLTYIRDDRLPNIVVVLAGREVPRRPPHLPVEFVLTRLACFDDSHVEEYLGLHGVSSPIQPPSSELCSEGEYVPGDLADKITRVKENWL